LAAGDSASALARRHFARYLALYQSFQAGASGEVQVAAALEPLTEIGWRILADRRWPGPSEANIDLILVGPGGVVVIDVKNWRRPPQPADAEVDKLLAVGALVERALGELRIAPSVVTAMMVFVNGAMDAVVGGVRMVGARKSPAAIAGLRTRLSPDAVERVAAHLAKAFPEHPGGRGEEPGAYVQPQLTLFDFLQMIEERRRAGIEGPIEEWMTFLPLEQYDLVVQDWSGPARITGVAGTGKSVVALHRAAYLARRRSGLVLYTTFAKNLPNVQAALLERLDPCAVDGVEFANLHAWAVRLLKRRGRPVRPDHGRGWFDLAWLRVGRRSTLATLRLDPGYWHEEIEYVIKGRGLVTLEEYLRVERHGRRTPIQARHREAVWEMFTEYERIRRERGGHDWADVLLLALDELCREPEREYSAVIADEVQDLTLVGVKVLHALAGDGPNGLLLVGDGRQAVYPGGFRLADAGVQVRGRSRILKRNYRNGTAIFERAQRFINAVSIDDIDDAPDAQPVDLSGQPAGEVIELTLPTMADIGQALVEAIGRLPDGPPGKGAAAVLCATNHDAERYLRRLTRAGVGAENLAGYSGRTSDTVKVGTLRRAKGLEFKLVFMPGYDQFIRRAVRHGYASEEWLAMARNQVYVGMTRARDTLWLATVPD
jgi:hypothetical protein